MKKVLSIILTAALLIAALAVPASATAVMPTEESKFLNDAYLYIHVNGDAAAPTKIVNISSDSALDDDILSLSEAKSVVEQYYSTENASWDGLYLENGVKVAEVTNLTAMRQAGVVNIRIFVQTDAVQQTSVGVTDIWGTPGDTVTMTLSLYDVTASSVGIKYSLPEGVEFVSGQWLLGDGVLSNVTGFGAAFAWSEARTISGDVLELTVRILEGAPISGSIPFTVVAKDVDAVICSESASAAVNVQYIINSFEIDCTGCNISAGTSRIIHALVDPEVLADQVVWYSSDESVAVVNDGMVTGISAGNACITAQLGDWICECSVNVFESSENAVTAPCMFTGEPGCVMHIRCILNNLFS